MRNPKTLENSGRTCQLFTFIAAFTFTFRTLLLWSQPFSVTAQCVVYCSVVPCTRQWHSNFKGPELLFLTRRFKGKRLSVIATTSIIIERLTDGVSKGHEYTFLKSDEYYFMPWIHVSSRPKSEMFCIVFWESKVKLTVSNIKMLLKETKSLDLKVFRGHP